MGETRIGLSASTQRTTSLRELLGDPTGFDRAALTERLKHIDPTLWKHAEAVATYVGAMVLQLPEVSADESAAFLDAAWLHDIGKLTISSETLRKPGPLSDAEWIEMREHPARGAAYLACSQILGSIAPIVRHHHERHEGHGYPDGLHGPQIELGARLIGVADAYDAMTSWRPYRPTMSHQEATAELLRSSGTQFEPSIVTLFIRAVAAPPRRPSQ